MPRFIEAHDGSVRMKEHLICLVLQLFVIGLADMTFRDFKDNRIENREDAKLKKYFWSPQINVFHCSV